MKRTSHLIPFAIALVAGVAIVGIAPLRARQVTQIHPAAGSGGPIVIAVLADNFTAAQVDDFNDAARNLFNFGLFDDALLQSHKDAFTIATVFHPVSQSNDSRYGFKIGNDGDTNCSVLWNQDGKDTVALVEGDAAQASAQYAVVIGNHGYNFGCQNDNWAYLTVGTTGLRVVHHEIAHLVFGLFDEFSLAQNLNVPYPNGPITWTTQNCSTNVNNPHWGNAPEVRLPECDLFGQGIVHGHHNCTMGKHDPKEFCPVCSKIIANEIACRTGSPECRQRPRSPTDPRVVGSNVVLANLTQPATQPAAEVQVLRLLVRVSRNANTPMTLVRATDAKGRRTVNNRRIGDFVYEVTDGGKSIGIGVIPGNPFQTRSYRGGATEHQSNPDDTTAIVIPIFGQSRDSVRAASSAIEVAIYRIDRAVGDELVDAELLTTLRAKNLVTRHAFLPAEDLRRQLDGMK